MIPRFTIPFLIFWGASFIVSWLIGGLLTFAYTLIVMLVLISHEYAHIAECQRLQVPVKSVTFTLLGGQVDADIQYAHEAVSVLSAGLKDSGMYAAFMAIVLFVLYTFRPIGVNFAQNPYLNLLNSVGFVLVLLLISNVLPISYKHKKHGMIYTDGWGAWKMRELRDEMWNDGKADAAVVWNVGQIGGVM